MESVNPVEYVKLVHERLKDLPYQFTGLTAVNFYGYGISTNVIDIAVKSDKAVHRACKLLGLEFNGKFDPFIHRGENFHVRIQGDLMDEPFIHPLGIYLQSKELLVRRLEIYSLYDARILQACAWIALTQTDEMALKYKYYWNRL